MNTGKGIAIASIWLTVAIIGYHSPEYINEIIGYAVGGIFIVAFFL